MGMDVGGSSSGPKSEINVTPLVDVVLVLLIIFMVIQPLMTRGYDVQVPPNAPSQPDQPKPQDQIILTMTGSNEIFLNKERVERQNLALRLAEVLRNRGSKVVFFSAEDNVKYGEAMTVMDLVRNNGAKNIGIVMDYVNPLAATQ
jgi:biopolymer transport protein ExbD